MPPLCLRHFEFWAMGAKLQYSCLGPDEIQFLKDYKFKKFHEQNENVLDPVVKFYYSLKKGCRESSFQPRSLEEIASIYLGQIGMSGFLNDLRSDFPNLDENRVRKLFARAIVQEAMERGVFDMINDMFPRGAAS